MLLLPRSQSADLGRWTFRRFRKSIALDNIRKGFRRSENQEIHIYQNKSIKNNYVKIQRNFRDLFGQKIERIFIDYKSKLS
jgi:hypothetical protein